MEEKRLEEKRLELFIVCIAKEAMLGRLIKNLHPKEKTIYKSKMMDFCIELISKIDDLSIKNCEIREKIYDLARQSRCSIGQAQKIINVVLKMYCYVKGVSDEIMKELDCPLDSTTTRHRISLRNLISREQYEGFQNSFEKDFGGMRIFRDIEYDNNRMELFFQN